MLERAKDRNALRQRWNQSLQEVRNQMEIEQIDEIAAKENIKTEQQILNINASIYKMMVAMEDIKDKSPDLLSKKEQKLCEQGIREMRDYLDGKEVSDT